MGADGYRHPMHANRGRHRIAALGAAAALLSGCATTGGEARGAGGATEGPSPQSAPAESADAPVEQQIARDLYDRVNAERAERGLEPLGWNDTLAEVAEDWSEQMAENDRLEHQDIVAVMEQEGLSGFRGIGENVFTATAPVPAGAMHVGWMESDGHRANVLNPGWNRMGVGVHCADDGSVWATQQFGRTVDADVPDLVEETPPEQPLVRSEEDGPTCA